MRKTNWIIGLMAVYAVTGCNQKNTEESTNLTPIVVDWNYKDLDYSHWVEDSVLVVPLETKDDCLIGEITYLVYQNHKIYVGDNLSKAVYVFDEKGRLLSMLRAVGNGPEEYLNIAAFTVMDSRLVIYDNLKRKILFYDENGSFLYEKDASQIWGVEMFCLDNSLYLLNDKSEPPMGSYHLFQLNPNEENDNIEAILASDKIDPNIGWAIDRYCGINKGEAIFTVWPGDVLYKLKEGEVQPAYKVDFGDKRLPEKYMWGDGFTAMKVALRDDYITGIKTVTHSDRYIFLTCSDLCNIIYDKKTGKELTAKRFYNKSLGGWALTLRWSSIQDGYLVTYRNVSSWVIEKELDFNWNEQDFKSEYVKGLFRRLQQANIEDNPVIIIQKIKEDVELF